MKREDATPYDGPCCLRCGRDAEINGGLCAECLEARSADPAPEPIEEAR